MVRIFVVLTVFSGGNAALAYTTPERYVAVGVVLAVVLSIAAMVIAIGTQRDLDRHLGQQTGDLAEAEAALGELHQMTHPPTDDTD